MQIESKGGLPVEPIGCAGGFRFRGGFFDVGIAFSSCCAKIGV